MTAHIVYIGLGSNLGNPVFQVSRALDALDTLPQTRVVRRSSLYRSAPVGYLEQPDFINAVVQLETELTPRALLDALLALDMKTDARANSATRRARLTWMCCCTTTCSITNTG